MTQRKSTKRKLLSSALALVMCISMLIGSTFAWFTDSVTSGSNTIQSGTLKVDLVDESGNSLEGKVIKFVDKDEDNDLWEPGCTYKTDAVYVKNNGSLALKYKIIINGIDGDAKLLEAIDWTITVGGTTTDLSKFEGNLAANKKSDDAIILKGHMKEEAGNEYQGLTVKGISISVIATQYTYEKDSNDDQYDKDAGYDYGKKNIGPYKLNVLSGGVATYDDATKTYSIAVNTVAQGGWNQAQNNYYAGYDVNVAGYGANATVSFDKPDGTTVWKLADEERDGFIKNGIHQQWTTVGTNRAYRYDIDGDGVTDFTVVNDASNAKVEVANAEQLTNVLSLGKSAILTANIALKEGITVSADADVTLDLNGKNITMKSETANSMITNKGSLTINGTGKIAYTFNGTINPVKAANTIENYGVLVVNGGEISNKGTGNQIGYGIDNQHGSILTVNGGKITATGSSYYDGIRLMCGRNDNTTVTVNGGEISSIWAQNPTANKATEVKGTVVINGGTVNTTYYENYTTVKVAEGVTATVTPYGDGSNNTTSAVVDGYTVYSFGR